MHYTEIFQTLAQNIAHTIATHSERAPGALSLTQAQKQKLRKAAEDMEFINAIAIKLPDSLEFCTLPSERVENSVSQKLRREFRNAVKNNYLETMANTPENLQAFMDMSLTEDEVKTLSGRGLLRDITRDGRQRDIIVDHIHDLTLGGENTFDNFMLVPDFMNQIKARLIHIQERVAPDLPERLSFKPKDGAAIPFIKTGFRPIVSGQALCRQIDDFLGLDP